MESSSIRNMLIWDSVHIFAVLLKQISRIWCPESSSDSWVTGQLTAIFPWPNLLKMQASLKKTWSAKKPGSLLDQVSPAAPLLLKWLIRYGIRVPVKSILSTFPKLCPAATLLTSLPLSRLEVTVIPSARPVPPAVTASAMLIS